MDDSLNNNNILNQILESIETLKNEFNTDEEKRNIDIKEIKKNFNEFKLEVNEQMKNLEEQINKNYGQKKLSKLQDIIRKNKQDNNEERLNNLQISNPLIENNSDDNLEVAQIKLIINLKL